MRKLLLIGIMCFVCAVYAQKQEVVIDTNYPLPEFHDKDAQLIDMNNIKGNFGSFIRVTNYSKFKGIEFEVFVHSPISSSWESLGTNRLAGFDDDVAFGKQYPNLKLYRYFAIVPKSESKAEYQYKIEKKMGRLDVSIFNQDANINATPLPSHPIANAYVFTDKKIPQGSKENIRLYNMTSTATVSISIFGWNKKEYQWVKLCTIAAQSGQRKPIVYESDDKKLSFKRFKYLAISNKDGVKYDYKFKEEHDDWTIIVEESF
ncbi:MAG: hypothetical protein J6P65_02450 [Bacteroidales bacterium]|nr:hypothetical protein [Bacteroidales bacterium]